MKFDLNIITIKNKTTMLGAPSEDQNYVYPN